MGKAPAAVVTTITRQLIRLYNVSGMLIKVSVIVAVEINRLIEVNQLQVMFRLTRKEEDSKKILLLIQYLHLRLFIRTSVTILVIEIISLNQTITSLKIHLMVTQVLINSFEIS